MELPTRAKQHISETASYKIFSSKVPDYWIIRDITERDYGIDCYIELVNNKMQLTDQLVSIQLKSRESIKWNITEPTKWTLSGVEISSTNYWYHFSVPVFIFIIDKEKQEVYFQSVSDYIKRNYSDYHKQGIFSYKIDKSNLFEGDRGLLNFLQQYFRDKHRTEFEKNTVTFFANYQQYLDFFQDNTYRDVFMGVETSRVLFARHFYTNFNFLCNYVEIVWDLKTFAEYEKMSQRIFGNDYDLYEQQLHEIVTSLNEKQLLILKKLKDIIVNDEESYWLYNDIKLYNYVLNASDTGEFADW